MIKKTQDEIMKKWPKEWNEPLVSIRCITYNHEKYIMEALDGFLMQNTDFPFEIVVHDDASTDRTADIIREYEAKYPRIIRPIYETENQYSKRDGSLVKAINPFLRGKYVAFCEGDDCWCSSDKLKKQLQSLEKNPDCFFCVHKVEAIREDGSDAGFFYPQQKQVNGKEGVILSRDFIARYMETYAYQTSSYFVRTDLYKNFTENPPEFRKIAPVGDAPLMLFFAAMGNVYYIDEVYSKRRLNSMNSWTTRMLKDESQQIKQHQALIMMLKEYNLFTQNKYSDMISHGIENIRFDIAMIECNFNSLLQPQFKKRLSKYSIKRRFFIYLGAYIPFAQKWIKNFFKQRKRKQIR